MGRGREHGRYPNFVDAPHGRPKKCGEPPGRLSASLLFTRSPSLVVARVVLLVQAVAIQYTEAEWNAELEDENFTDVVEEVAGTPPMPRIAAAAVPEAAPVPAPAPPPAPTTAPAPLPPCLPSPEEGTAGPTEVPAADGWGDMKQPALDAAAKWQAPDIDLDARSAGRGSGARNAYDIPGAPGTPPMPGGGRGGGRGGGHSGHDNRGGGRPQRTQAPAGTTLYVGNLQFDTTDEDIRGTFGPFGEIKRVFMNKGFCHIDFSSTDGADSAYAGLNGIDFGGRILRCDIVGNNSNRGGTQAVSNISPQHRLKVGNLAFSVRFCQATAHRGPSLRLTPRVVAGTAAADGDGDGDGVGAGGRHRRRRPMQVKTDGLMDAFSSFGATYAEVIMDRDNRTRSRGFGFVTFSSETSLQLALQELQNKQLK